MYTKRDKENLKETKTYIKSYCCIKNKSIILNGISVFSHPNADFKGFSKKAYSALDISYSKFFKMDSLSKLGFLAADTLLKDQGIAPSQEKNIALVFANKASSLDTDRKHQESIQESKSYYPSPAVFVYTLPNICLGEISIKYKLYSENSFFIFDDFNAKHLFNYSNSLLTTGKAEEVLCGWVNFDNEDYNAFLYLISKEGNLEHNETNILKLYNT